MTREENMEQQSQLTIQYGQQQQLTTRAGRVYGSRCLALEGRMARECRSSEAKTSTPAMMNGVVAGGGVKGGDKRGGWWWSSWWRWVAMAMVQVVIKMAGVVVGSGQSNMSKSFRQ